ncbi:MAG: DUF1501 domain-containing protein [Acidobacteriota bacterium]
MAKTRRDFLKQSLMLVSIGGTVPNFLIGTAQAQELRRQAASGEKRDRILVVLQLTGGNDGLNTVVPHRDELYYKLRPGLAVPSDQVLALDKDMGLHPQLRGLKGLYDNGQLAIVQNVGYPNPNRSHFRSMEIWHTAKPDVTARSGWLGRFYEEKIHNEKKPLSAVNLGQELPLSLVGDKLSIPSIGDPAQFQLLLSRDPERAKAYLRTQSAATGRGHLEFIEQTALSAMASSEDLQGALRSYSGATQYPANALGRNMKLLTQMILADLGTRLFYVSLGGFDTHRQQRNAHANLLGQLASATSAFFSDLKAHGKDKEVLLMTFSEFGRRVSENGSAGTDHGTAAPLFIAGGDIRGGLYGEAPDLANLDAGDLRFKTDFRSVYATVLENWMGTPSQNALGAKYPVLEFV